MKRRDLFKFLGLGALMPMLPKAPELEPELEMFQFSGQGPFLIDLPSNETYEFMADEWVRRIQEARK